MSSPFTADLPHEPCVEAVLPLVWRSHADSLQASAGGVEGSALTLQSLLHVGENSHKEPGDESAEVMKEITRLDAKLNLLLELVGDLLVSIQPLPAPVQLRLTAKGITWIAQQPAVPGARGEVHVYLNPELPRPVCLPGTVRGAVAGRAGTEVQVEFDPMPPGLDDLLEKFVFQWHRRVVAERRRGRGGDVF